VFFGEVQGELKSFAPLDGSHKGFTDASEGDYYDCECEGQSELDKAKSMLGKVQ
jgi:hypothetical protein